MCRADVTPAAEAPLARVLVEMARELARLTGNNLDDVHIGPVDFGPDRSKGDELPD